MAAALGTTGALVLPAAFGFDPKWGLAGLTAGSGIGAWIEYSLLRRALSARIGPTGLPSGLLAKLWGAAALSAGIGFGVKMILTGLHPVALGAGVLTTFGVAYFTATSLMRIPESASALAMVRARLGGRRAP